MFLEGKSIKAKSWWILFFYLTLWGLVHTFLINQFIAAAKIPTINELWKKHNSLSKFLNDINFWSTWLGIIIYLFIEIMIVSGVILLFSKVLKANTSFYKCLIVVVLSHSIFLVEHAIECLFVITDPFYFSNIDRSHFVFLSVSYFLNNASIPFDHTLNYLFEILNFFEIIYWFLLALFFSKVNDTPCNAAVKVIAISYIPILFFWVILITFIQFINT